MNPQSHTHTPQCSNGVCSRCYALSQYMNSYLPRINSALQVLRQQEQQLQHFLTCLESAIGATNTIFNVNGAFHQAQPHPGGYTTSTTQYYYQGQQEGAAVASNPDPSTPSTLTKTGATGSSSTQTYDESASQQFSQAF